MGAVSAGWIKLDGPMLEMCCVRDESSYSNGRRGSCYLVMSFEKEELSCKGKKLRSEATNTHNLINKGFARLGIAPLPENYIGHAIFDEKEYFSSIVTCLLFCNSDTTSNTSGLILQCTERDNEYRRIGYWTVGESRPDLALLWARFNRRAITLV